MSIDKEMLRENNNNTSCTDTNTVMLSSKKSHNEQLPYKNERRCYVNDVVTTSKMSPLQPDNGDSSTSDTAGTTVASDFVVLPTTMTVSLSTTIDYIDRKKNTEHLQKEKQQNQNSYWSNSRSIDISSILHKNDNNNNGNKRKQENHQVYCISKKRNIVQKDTENDKDDDKDCKNEPKKS